MKLLRNTKSPNTCVLDVKKLSIDLKLQRDNMSKARFDDTEENIYEVFKLLENINASLEGVIDLKEYYARLLAKTRCM